MEIHLPAAIELEEKVPQQDGLLVSAFLRLHGLEPTRLLYRWDSPGENTGVGCHYLLQGIFLTQGLNPGTPPCRRIFTV